MVKSRQSDVSCRVTLVMAACLSASPLLATSSFVSRSEYLDLMEAAVSAYSDEHIASYVEDTEKNGVQEHGFPRLTANLGFLAANGRLPAKRETFKRMMSLACRGVSTPATKFEGHEFSIKELVLALLAIERAGTFGGPVTAAWRADLNRVNPNRCYSSRPETGADRADNWSIFGCASEQARIAANMDGDAEFVEKYVGDQLRFFDANGMFRDPGQPAFYDLVTRLQFMVILHCGYNGPSRAKLEGFLDRTAEPTLAMFSACGEIPYGGRSNQFLHNHTAFAAVCEWYATRNHVRGNDLLAARFRRAARSSVDALKAWLSVRPVRHVKNLYPRDTGSRTSGIGCEGYAYFDKYMVTMGSWAMLAYIFADESIPVIPASDSDLVPLAFATTPDFHFLFLRAGDYSGQFDYASDEHYDCDGLGRLQRSGAPAAICISTPCAAKPRYRIETPNATTLAIIPVDGSELTPTGCGHDMGSAWANWKIGRLSWTCRLTADGLESVLKGAGDIELKLPAFAFDGERETEIACNDKSLVIRYRGWTCRYETNGTIIDTGTTCCNRNGRYRVFVSRGKDSLVVKTSIFSSQNEDTPKRKGESK